MAATSNIVRRGRIFHFRRAVPADLRERLKRRELVRSLGACGPKVARLRADELYWLSEQLFETARANPMLTQDQLARLAQSFYNHILERESAVRASGVYFTNDGRIARANYWENVAAQARESLGGNTLDHGADTARNSARLAGLKWDDLNEAERSQCKETVIRAGIDLAEALKARYEGDFEFEPKSKLLRQSLLEVAVAAPPPVCDGPISESARPLLSERFPDFIATQLRRGGWKQQTASQAVSSYRLFIGICGDKPIEMYGRGDAKAFRETAERMPWDYGKAAAYRNKSPQEIIAIFEKRVREQDQATLSQKTIKRHFSALSAIWDDARVAGEVSENIFGGFKFSSGVRAVEQRKDWSADELKALFQSPVWTGCLSSVHRSQPGVEIIRDEKFWAPLIGIFSAMRLEEICQLHAEDICTADEISFFDIKVGKDRQLKNRNSVRQVPIHSELIKLGILKKARQSAKGSRQLFPDLTPGGADNKLGHSLSKWFTRYRREINVYRAKLDFHSLRHTANTLMHQADVSDAVRAHILGHSRDGETARYTKRSTLQQLSAAIETIRPELNLQHLYEAE